MPSAEGIAAILLSLFFAAVGELTTTLGLQRHKEGAIIVVLKFPILFHASSFVSNWTWLSTHLPFARPQVLLSVLHSSPLMAFRLKMIVGQQPFLFRITNPRVRYVNLPMEIASFGLHGLPKTALSRRGRLPQGSDNDVSLSFGMQAPMETLAW